MVQMRVVSFSLVLLSEVLARSSMRDALFLAKYADDQRCKRYRERRLHVGTLNFGAKLV